MAGAEILRAFSNSVRNQVGQHESDVDIFRDSFAELHVLSSIKQLSSPVCSSGCPRIGRRPAGTEFFRIEWASSE